MNKDQRLQHYKKSAEEYRDYAADLENQLKECTDRLADIAIWVVPKAAPEEWTFENRIKWSAAFTLKSILSKINLKKPQGYLHPQ